MYQILSTILAKSPRHFALVLLALVLSACAQKPDTEQTEKDPSALSEAKEISDLQADPALVTGRLDNGLRYAVLRNKTPVGTGALRVQFQTGSLNELPGTEGLAHYLEHMAFNGSTNVPEGEMIQILERLGLSFGADTNATTGLDRTVYKLNLPNLTPAVLDAAFMLMKETAQNLTLDQDAIDRELGIILSEKRTRDAANYRAWEARMRFLTNNSDLMDRLPIGNEQSLRNIDSADFRAYYSAHYHPEKTIVAFVGDIAPQEVVAYIKDTFEDWQPNTQAQNDRLASPANIPKNDIAFYAEEGLSTNVSLIALRPYVKKPDNTATRNQRLLERIATGMIGYRMRELAEQSDRPFISATMRSFSTFKLTEGISFDAYTDPKDWEKTLNGLDIELRRVLQFGFTQAELTAQLARLESLYKALADGADTRPTTSRRGGLIDSLMASFDNETVFTHPSQNYERFLGFKNSVTLAQVNEVIRAMWGDINSLNVFISTSQPLDEPQQQIRTALNKSRAQDIPAPVDTDGGATEFAYTEFGEAGKIVSDTYNDEIDAHLIKFDNNVRLNFKQTRFDEDRVRVHVKFGDGNMSTPRKSEGLRRMAYGIMAQSGFEDHTLAEVRRLTAGKLVSNSGFNFRAGGDHFFMSTTTVPNNFRDQLNLFAATLTAPGFRENARINHINKLKAWYPRHDTSLTGAITKQVPRIIRSGDKRFGFDEEDSFYEPTMEEVATWLKPQLQNGLIEITIVGDIDKASVVKHISETFGALPTRADRKSDYPEMLTLAFPEGKETPYQVFHRGDDNQAQLRVYWPASDGFDAQYSRQLSVLRSVLRNRLVKEIREGAATTYSPQASSFASQIYPGYGYIAAILTLKPEDMQAMSDKVHSIANEIADDSITEDEFARAITPMIERIKSTKERNAYWLSVLSDAQTDGIGLRQHASRESDLREMTAADVQTLANQIFQKGQSTEIHALPHSVK